MASLNNVNLYCFMVHCTVVFSEEENKSYQNSVNVVAPSQAMAEAALSHIYSGTSYEGDNLYKDVSIVFVEQKTIDHVISCDSRRME